MNVYMIIAIASLALAFYLQHRANKAWPALRPAGLACSHCSSQEFGRGHRTFTAAGILTLIVGIVLAPFIIGFFFIGRAFWLREVKYRCLNCCKTF